MKAARNDGDDRVPERALLHDPPDAGSRPFFADHRSHRSHASHVSGSYSYTPRYPRGGRGGGDYPIAAEPAPARPAHVSIIAYPGGRITVDGRVVGTDVARNVTLQPGSHTVRIENSLVGDTERQVTITDGQTGVVVIEW